MYTKDILRILAENIVLADGVGLATCCIQESFPQYHYTRHVAQAALFKCA